MVLTRLGISMRRKGIYATQLASFPVASVTAQSQQQAIFRQMQQMLSNRPEPLTSPGPLADEFRATATHLFTTFVKFEGAQVAHMMRKSVEARDWLRCMEPRSVRSVIKRILEDFASIDVQVRGTLYMYGV